MAHEGMVLSYQELYQKIWWKELEEKEVPYRSLVANVIFHLRGKLGKKHNEGERIRIKGYQFCR